MYTTKGTEEKEFKSKYIAPGVQKVKIVSITGMAPEGKSPYLELAFVNQEEMTANIRFYMSEKAMPKSLEKIKHIGTKMVTNDDLDAIKADSIDSYGAALNGLLAGKTCRIKFTGEEVESEKGIWTKAGIGLPTFAEATKDGAQYPAVDDEDTKLVYDENNKWDLKRLAPVDAETDDFTTTPSKETEEPAF